MNIDKKDVDRGIYDKFYVSRNDGESRVGGKHWKCEYFVLDVSHDPHAIPALAAYADSCEKDYPALAADIREKWSIPPPPGEDWQ